MQAIGLRSLFNNYLQMPGDLNLLYSGGSGGFILLHFLLLSEQFDIVLKSNKSCQDAVKCQWQISNPDKWKSNECWPDNAATSGLQTDKRKIYFFCNPQQHPDLRSYCKYNVGLYVDYASQLKLAYFKKAWIYEKKFKCAQDPKFTAMRQLLRNWKSHYNNIKDETWPKYTPIKNVHSLPKKIKREILQDPYTRGFLEYYYQKPIIRFRGQTVFSGFVPYLHSADVVIKLQDFINSRGQSVVDLLKLPAVNAQQVELIEHWCSLHPKDLLEQVGINV